MKYSYKIEYSTNANKGFYTCSTQEPIMSLEQAQGTAAVVEQSCGLTGIKVINYVLEQSKSI